MASKSRNTENASLIEMFLDENENDLSPNMFAALEDVAEEIDSRVRNLFEEIEELNDTIEELNEELEAVNND